MISNQSENIYEKKLLSSSMEIQLYGRTKYRKTETKTETKEEIKTEIKTETETTTSTKTIPNCQRETTST